MLSLALLCLASAALAIPAPTVHDFTPLVRGLRGLAPAAEAHLNRRQGASDALDGLEDLLEKVVAGQSSGQCSSECSDWVDAIYDCSEADSYTQVGMCACGYGGSEEEGAKDFADYCADALGAVSSIVSRTASAGTSSAFASRTSTPASGFASATSAGSEILSDINSATSRAPQASGASQDSSSEGPDSAGVSPRVGSALVAALAGGAAAVLAL